MFQKNITITSENNSTVHRHSQKKLNFRFLSIGQFYQAVYFFTFCSATIAGTLSSITGSISVRVSKIVSSSTVSRNGSLSFTLEQGLTWNKSDRGMRFMYAKEQLVALA